jgi:hypothetical protein
MKSNRERAEKMALEWFQRFDPVDTVDSESVDWFEKALDEVRDEAIEEDAAYVKEWLSTAVLPWNIPDREEERRLLESWGEKLAEAMRSWGGHD